MAGMKRSIYMPEEWWQAVQRAAKAEDRSANYIVKRAIAGDDRIGVGTVREANHAG